MSEIDGATLMARSLKQQSIDHLFGVVEFPVGPIAAAAQKEGVAYIGMRNEQAASYAAQAYGYLTGRPGACIVVTGPGVVHGLAGLANAQQNCRPMILTGGASETYRGGMGAFQEERQVLIAPRLSRPSRVTTLPAPMSASSPIETPGRMIAPAPIQTLRPIRTGRPNSRSKAASRRDRLRQPGTRAV